MFLGINLSHSSSAALLDNDGRILYAIEEERISRVKNHVGIPLESISEIFAHFDVSALKKVIVGSHSNLNLTTVNRFIAQELGNSSNPRGHALPVFPSYKQRTGDAKKILVDFLQTKSALSKNSLCEHVFTKHHDSHLGCGIPLLNGKRGLIISLDGEGDGESGALALRSSDQRLSSIARIDSLDSLGLLYSAVTKSYNFKPIHHEGKITGLAAFGEYSKVVDCLIKFVNVDNGQITLRYPKTKLLQYLLRTAHSFGVMKHKPYSIDSIIEQIVDNGDNYADLAFAVQEVLERSVLEILTFYLKKTESENIALTGGVFSNVKLNQRITEICGVNEVTVFPNMGDGGLAVGGVWAWMQSHGLKVGSGDLLSTMFLGTTRLSQSESFGREFSVEPLSDAQLHQRVAQDIYTGKVVAVLRGRMEFGPRALGNTSILLDPRSSKVVSEVNSRLKRTEFMPFAPCVLDRSFSDYFYTKNKNLQPFYFMTMTCDVISSKRNQIPAVTHIDGTARPQIVSKDSNLFLFRVLEAFEDLTGVPVLVNTSFNSHEEPIIRTLDEALASLKKDIIDVLYADNFRCTRLFQ